MTEKAAIDAALQANKGHQHALKAYIERLETELQAVDKMIEDVDTDDDAELTQDDSIVYVEGARKPVSMVLPRVLLSDDSPFFEDARWKERYDEFTTVNQMKTKEHDALREAVRSENIRMQMLEAQKRNQPIDIKSFPLEHFEQNTEGIDWRRVSVKVNSLLPSSNPRTPKECEIRWLGHLHPPISNSPWTPEETGRLKDILAEDGPDKRPRDWVDIARRLGTNRTPIDCMRHGMTRRVHIWSPEADKKLLEAVGLYGQNNWQLVAMNVSEDATAHQCQKRYLDTLDPSIKSGPWSSEEDERLRRAIAAFAEESVLSEEANISKRQSISWQDVALFVPGRTNNQCREHYNSMLKSKKGQRKKGSARSTKGKEKAETPEMLNDGEKPSDSLSGSEDETVQMDKPEPKAISKSSTRAKGSRKGKGGIDAPGKSSETSPGIADPNEPKPKSRVRHCSHVRAPGDLSMSAGAPIIIEEPSSEEISNDHRVEPEVQADSQVEPGRRAPLSAPDNTTNKDAGPSQNLNLESEGRRRSSRRGKHSKEPPGRDTEVTGSSQPGVEINGPKQETMPLPSEPATKRRKTVTPSKKIGDPKSTSPPAQNQTADTGGSASMASTAGTSEQTTNKDVRRSSRLAKSIK